MNNYIANHVLALIHPTNANPEYKTGYSRFVLRECSFEKCWGGGGETEANSAQNPCNLEHPPPPNVEHLRPDLIEHIYHISHNAMTNKGKYISYIQCFK